MSLFDANNGSQQACNNCKGSKPSANSSLSILKVAKVAWTTLIGDAPSSPDSAISFTSNSTKWRREDITDGMVTFSQEGAVEH
jgi:hypothetical protein